MKNRDIIVTLLLLILLCSIPKARAESLSVAAYQQQLQGIVAKVESLESQPENAGALVASIPDQVSVTTDSGEIKVSYKGTIESPTVMKGTAVYAGFDEKATWSATKN